MYLLTTRHLTETTASAAILARRVLRKAVIPAAGLGRRMSSLTGGAPKEMLPLAGRPIIAVRSCTARPSTSELWKDINISVNDLRHRAVECPVSDLAAPHQAD